ncbi:MAG: carboxylating nicotinate-nucleotide diphosphorylase [Planctomycetes bacterium]|nr:carboxylating nicotinate-nucleotide diphosphorylase [Planctomycetota bacterium]
MQDLEPPLEQGIQEQVRQALLEDHAWADATSDAVVPDGAQASGRIVAKASGVLSGVNYARVAFDLCEPDGKFQWSAGDGSAVKPGDVVMTCSGSAKGLLAAERTALNFLQQLSGVATVTALAVAAGLDFQVLDTRKTTPGLRDAQKAAVVAGGGVNHRRDLEDQILIKENHFALAGVSYAEAVAKAVAKSGGKIVGAEAQNLQQACDALAEGATYVMLDNFPRQTLAAAIQKIRDLHPNAKIEVSGGLDPASLGQLTGMGVDRVSLGLLTHSAPALDLSFLFDEPTA